MKASIGAKMYWGEIKRSPVTLEEVKSDGGSFLEQLKQEVVRNRSKGRQLKRIILATQTACLSLLVLAQAQPTFAMEVSNVKSEASTLMLELMVVVALLGVGASVIGLMLAGIWKMAMGSSQADQWTHNIIKGLGQVIGAPAIVALIVGVAALLFQGIPIFQPIGGAIDAFLGN